MNKPADDLTGWLKARLRDHVRSGQTHHLNEDDCADPSEHERDEPRVDVFLHRVSKQYGLRVFQPMRLGHCARLPRSQSASTAQGVK